jgi:hypothetical protein
MPLMLQAANGGKGLVPVTHLALDGVSSPPAPKSTAAFEPATAKFDYTAANVDELSFKVRWPDVLKFVHLLLITFLSTATLMQYLTKTVMMHSRCIMVFQNQLCYNGTLFMLWKGKFIH